MARAFTLVPVCSRSSRVLSAARSMRKRGRSWPKRDSTTPRCPHGREGRGSASPLTGDLAKRAFSLGAESTNPSRATPFGVRPLAAVLADLRRAAGPATVKAAATRAEGGSSGASPEFVDDAAEAGLRFVFDNGQTPRISDARNDSGGVGLLDFDGDGWLDVYCVQGGAADRAGPATRRRPGGPTGDRLFRNQGDGTFEDVTEASGIAAIAWGRGYGMGVTVGDYDNDGHPDLFVTRLELTPCTATAATGPSRMSPSASGLAGRRDNPTSAAFADLDNDGDLDLYVCHYMIWDPDESADLSQRERRTTSIAIPSKVEPAPDHVFRNDGGRFVDVTEAAGLDRSSRAAAWASSPPTSTTTTASTCTSPTTARPTTCSATGAAFTSRRSALEAGVAGSAVGRLPGRAWAWPAATSTATAGPT